MKQFRQFNVAVAFMMATSIGAYAAVADSAREEEAPMKLKSQTHCPVMGGKIDSTVFTDIQGQRVYHCCPMCSKKLKADPDKFFKKAAEEGILFENVQTACPVSGMDIKERTAFTDFEGRRVYFCCDGCIEPFTAEPHRYLSKLDAPSRSKGGTDDREGLEGHGH